MQWPLRRAVTLTKNVQRNRTWRSCVVWGKESIEQPQIGNRKSKRQQRTERLETKKRRNESKQNTRLITNRLET